MKNLQNNKQKGLQGTADVIEFLDILCNNLFEVLTLHQIHYACLNLERKGFDDSLDTSIRLLSRDDTKILVHVVGNGHLGNIRVDSL